MRVPHKARVVVADGRNMHMLRNDGTPDEPRLTIERSESRPNPRDHDHKTDAAGRTMSTQPGAGAQFAQARSAMEETDFHQQEEDRFAAQIAAMLDTEAQAGNFTSLIVVATPRTLGEMRKHYGRHAAACLVAEVDKDLVSRAPQDLAEALLNLPL